MSDTKRCPGCKQDLPRTTGEDGFWTASRNRGDGLEAICRQCKRKRNRGIAKKHKASRPVVADPLAFDIDVEVPEPPLPIDEILRAIRKPISFEALCDRLGLAPAKCRQVLEQAQARGVPVAVHHNQVAFSPEQPRDDIQETHVEPTVGEMQRVAVISDLHFGSRYCLLGALRDFLQHAYSEGCREALVLGDVMDGNYTSHGLHELTHVGLDQQAQLVASRLPRFEGLTYHAIMGNHDLTFETQNGASPGRALLGEFQRVGRNDLKVYGSRGAFVRIRGALVHLWHPGKGRSYATSYGLQKKVESYSPGEKPQILLAGHWHAHCSISERGVHALACPTFQGGGSAFSKSLTGSVAIGGLILEWSLTASGTIRDFRHTYRQYFERERVASV